MAGWIKGGVVLLLCLLWRGGQAAEMPADSVRRGLDYQGSDPYAALSVAKRERKLLLVEFYADWNHRSRWMSEQVLSDSTVRELVGANFVAVQIQTRTAAGAELAGLYEVTDYPSIVIFNSNGDVLDKVDVTLDADDFEQRLRTILMTVQGMGTWQLRQVYAAAERADYPETDAAAADFLGRQLPQDVANSVVWPMFENSAVTRYGSTAFNYLVTHAEMFRKEIGRESVDKVLTDALWEAMLPYVVGSVPYGADVAGEMVRTAEVLELGAALSLRSMSDVAGLRSAEDLSLFVARLRLLLNMVPESYHLPLALSLDIVADRGSRDNKSAALEIVDRVQTSTQSPANAAMLEFLRDRLK